MNRAVCFRCDKPTQSIFKMTPDMLKHKKAYDLIRVNGFVSAMCSFFGKGKKDLVN